MDLLGISPQSYPELIRQTLYRNLEISGPTRKRHEPSTFCDRLIATTTTSHILIFRVQKTLEAGHLNSPIFVNSNLHLNEGLIMKFGSKSFDDMLLLQNTVQFLYLNIPNDMMPDYAAKFMLTDDDTY